MKYLNWKIQEKEFFYKTNHQYHLDNMLKALAYLDNCHKQIEQKVIHVAGTNGKGSVVSYIRTILETAGYKVGAFTSPHLIDYNERIYFNGRYATDSEIEECRNTIIQKCANVDEISYFEATTLIAIQLFAKANLDYCIFEVGLGGRLDATNIFQQKLASVITSISFDHTKILGNTLAKIAYEKGGIIKQNVPVFTSNTNPEVVNVIQHIANDNNTKLFCQDRDYSVDNTLKLGLKGEHQIINANLAKAVCEYLEIDNKYILKGLAQTTWPGRLQEVQLNNIDNTMYNIDKIYLDGGHNEDGIKSLCTFIAQQKQKYRDVNIIGICAVLKRKDYASFFPILAQTGFNKLLFYQVPLGVNDFVETDVLKTLATSYNIACGEMETFNTLPQVIDLKKRNIIFIFGSLYFVGFVLENFVKKTNKR